MFFVRTPCCSALFSGTYRGVQQRCSECSETYYTINIKPPCGCVTKHFYRAPNPHDSQGFSFYCSNCMSEWSSDGRVSYMSLKWREREGISNV